MAGSPAASRGTSLVTHFIVSDDVERSRRFYTEVLGGTVVFGPEPTNVRTLQQLDHHQCRRSARPTTSRRVTLETPRDPDRVSSFLNIRVKDIEAVYAEWSARGAQFLTPPKQHQYEIRCYINASRRSSHRSGSDDGPTGGLVTRSVALNDVRRGVRVTAAITGEIRPMGLLERS